MASSPGSVGQHVAGEDVRHMPHGLVAVDLAAVAGADAGALLPAMLQRVEAEVGQLGRFGMAVDGDHAALVVEFIEHEIIEDVFECPLVSGSRAPRCPSEPSVMLRLPDLASLFQL